MKRVYFSKVCNQTEINSKFAKKGMYRYSLYVPFENRENGIHAIVILKNPSNAGRRTRNNKYISDDTVYRVLDYLYKQQDNIYSRVTILNLFPHVAGETKNIKEIIRTDTGKAFIKKNDIFIRRYLENLKEDYQIIAAWGGHSEISERLYKQRIREIFKLFRDKNIYRVGPMVGKNKQYPGHGKYWYDYEDLLPYSSTGIQ